MQIICIREEYLLYNLVQNIEILMYNKCDFLAPRHKITLD